MASDGLLHATSVQSSLDGLPEEKLRSVHERVRSLKKADLYRSLGVSFGMLVFSLAMAGALIDYGTTHLPEQWRFVSGAVGWLYFSAWSVSFYPQPLVNYARKSVVGMSFDYQLYNIIGFLSYSIFNCAFFFNSDIQEAYRAANHGQSNQVQANDVFFALHALAMTLVIVAQIFMYERGSQKFSLFAIVISVGSVAVMIVYAVLIVAGVQAGEVFTWLSWVYAVSYVKLGVTLIKYVPQAIMNAHRHTTDGFNMHNVLLDFTGGLLSVGQLLLDCAVTSDWSGITGTLVKFLLGLTSMVFDVVFMIQHYLCFHEKNQDLFHRRVLLEMDYGAEEASRLLAQAEAEPPLASSTDGFSSLLEEEGQERLSKDSGISLPPAA
jgi:cystinosin